MSLRSRRTQVTWTVHPETPSQVANFGSDDEGHASYEASTESMKASWRQARVTVRKPRSYVTPHDAATIAGPTSVTWAFWRVLSPGVVELVGALSALERRPGVTVAVPSHGVPMDGRRATEIVAVVAACLDNVATHVGRDAPTWVLLEASTD